MPGIDLPFYATESEITKWMADFLDAEDIVLTAMKFFPFSAEIVSPVELPRYTRDPAVERFCFFTEMPDMSLSYQTDFDSENENGLILDCGRLASDGLHPSWCSCKVTDPIAFATWKRMAKKIRGQTCAGVTYFGKQNSGPGSYDRLTRYSPGAKLLEDSGLKMLPLGGDGEKAPLLYLGKLEISED